MKAKLKLVLALLVLPLFFFACGEELQNGLDDTTPPVVTITDPSENDSLAEAFTVTATAVDNESKIIKVDFFFDGKKVSGESFPLEANALAQSSMIYLSTVTNGTYRIDVVAKNGIGLVATNSINVTIAKGSEAAIPSVVITAPEEGSVKTANFNITGTATVASGSVTNVKVYFSDMTTPLDGDAGASFNTLVDITSLPNVTALYPIKVRAAANGKSTTALSFVYVTKFSGVDTTAPVIASVSPASGATVSADFVIGANVSDPESGVANVKFFFNGAAKGVDTTAPYQSTPVSIVALDNGSYPVRVEAYNGEGLATTNIYNITIQKSVVVQNAHVTNVVTIANDYSAFDAPSVTVNSATPTLHWTSGGIGGIQSYKVEIWDDDEENVFWAVANIGNGTLQLPYGIVPAGAVQLTPASGAPSNLADGLYTVNVVGINNANWEVGEPVAIAHLRMTVSLPPGAARSAEPMRMMPRAEYEQLLRDRRGW